MITVEKDYSLKHLNTFGIDTSAKYYVQIRDTDELRELLSQSEYKEIGKMVLGGGSNILFANNYPGLIIHNLIKGIEEKQLDENKVLLKIGAGEVWDEIVNYAVNKGLGGIENLSLIPGSVGAAPIQNIGAYGVEIESVFHSLIALDINTLEEYTFNKSQCKFGYRNSVFKNELNDRFIITHVSLVLNKNPQINLSYSSLKSAFDKSEKDISIKDVRNKVIEIRESKLPNPDKLHNAGSFFKNPEINGQQLKKLLTEFPDLIYFQINGDSYKIAAGWLIEQCGLKGIRDGNVGTYYKQALVLINYGAKSGEEILKFAKLIQSKVMDKFGILLEPEVNIIQ